MVNILLFQKKKYTIYLLILKILIYCVCVSLIFYGNSTNNERLKKKDRKKSLLNDSQDFIISSVNIYV